MAARTWVPCHIASASSSVGNARGCCGIDDRRALSTVSLGPAVARILVSSDLESIATHSDSMSCLLAARGRCVVHRDRGRRIDHYVRGQLLGRLMRHLRGLVSIEVALM